MKSHSRTRFLLLLLIVWTGWILSACEEPPPAKSKSAPAPRAENVPQVFERAWKACGGVEGAGQWIYGPAWFKGNLVGVARHMVFVWWGHAPRYGAQPLQTMLPPKGAPQQPKIPEFFTQWINHHGGHRCSGKPLTAPNRDGNTICQEFANLTLCSDTQGKKVWATDRGDDFYHEHGKELLSRLPTTLAAKSGWNTQVNLTLSNDRRSAQIIARVTFNDGADYPQPPSLAVQINDSRLGPIYFDLQEVPYDGVWKHTVHLPQLGEGNHTLVVQTCAVAANAWQACDEDVAQLKITP